MDIGTQVNRFARLAGFCGLLFGALACQPVFVIGWQEFFVVLILVVLLIGLPLYRFIRRSKRDKPGD